MKLKGSGEQQYIKNPTPRNLGTLIALAFFMACFPAMIVYAAVVFQRPVGWEPNSSFKIRMHPIHKVLKPHKGIDYKGPIGTPVNVGTGIKGFRCKNDPDGFGSYAEVDYDCDVTAIYAHLSKCDAATQTALTGNSGGSTGPHLHFEIRLGGPQGASVPAEPVIEREYNAQGQLVDIDMDGDGIKGETLSSGAIGKDLCDPAVRQQLIDEANNILNGLAGKDGGKTPNTSGGSATYVPPGSGGGTIPNGSGGTITLPPGGGYYIVTDEDGRTEIVVDISEDTPDVPILPPGTAPNLTPSTDTDNEVTGCATDTWTAMVNQSVLQTRREMIANQTYIAKPDSVMAYSCLTDQIDHVREDLGPIFSETKRWVNVEVDIIGKTVTVNKELGEYSLDGAIVNVALSPYEIWMRSFFGHDFLGGTETTAHTDHGDHAHTEDQSYAGCGVMAQVWQMAKCRNADDEQMFYKFEDLIGNDPRKFPEGYACNNTGITQAMIDTAKGKQVKFDKVDSYVDRLFPGDDGQCAPPVPTGVTVVRREIGEFTDAEIAAMDNADIDDLEGVMGSMRDPNVVSSEKQHADGVCLTAGCTFVVDEDGKGSCVLEKPEAEEPAPVERTGDPVIDSYLEMQEGMRQGQ